MTDHEDLERRTATIIATDPGVAGIYPPRGRGLHRPLGESGRAPVVISRTENGVEVTAAIASDESLPTPQTLRRVADAVARELKTSLPGLEVVIRMQVGSVDQPSAE